MRVGPLGLSPSPLFIENKNKVGNIKNIKKRTMGTHKPQPRITIIHVLMNVIFYYENYILFNLD